MIAALTALSESLLIPEWQLILAAVSFGAVFVHGVVVPLGAALMGRGR